MQAATSPSPESRALLRGDLAILAAIASLRLVIYAVAGGRYGYQRDELYYLACSEHLAAGYVDFAPFLAYLAAGVRSTLGASLYAIRLLPAVAGACSVILTGLLARRLGGGRTAMIAAAATFAVVPTFVFHSGYMLPIAFEALSWTALAYVLVVIVSEGRTGLLPLAGLIAGLGMMNRHHTVFFVVALAVALAFSRHRKLLLTPMAAVAAAVALAVCLPNLVWQWQNDWATYRMLSAVAASNKNYVMGPGEFLWRQAWMLLPVTLPLWLGGLAWLTFARRGGRYRFLAVAFLITFVIVFALKGKDYYIASLYPVLFAAGAVALEHVGWRRLRLLPALTALTVAGGLALLPMGAPVLPVETFLRYAAWMHYAAPRTDNYAVGVLPSHYASMFGWPELAEDVAKVYQSLDEDDRRICGIFAQNYGQAGALDLFGKPLGLPPALSGHENYYLWGPRGYTGEVMIVFGGTKEDLGRVFEEVTLAAVHTHPYAPPFEQDAPIFVCRRMKVPMAELWPQTLNYI